MAKALKDSARIAEGGTVEVHSASGVVAQPMTLNCPKCGSVSKADHAPGTRICFNKDCRERFSEVEAVATSVGASFPCSKCGCETKEHHTPKGSRICSSRDCRAVVEV